MSPDVTLIEDDEHVRRASAQALELAGLSVASFGRAEDAVAEISRASRSVIVTDVRMPGLSGLELMSKVLAVDPELPVILITGHGDIAMAVDAIRAGAYDFIEKPFAPDRLVDSVKRAREKRTLVLDNRALREALAAEPPLAHRIVGQTPAIVRLRDEIASFAATDADVLVLGETGTGKELVARSLHELSSRASARFVAINCGALPDTIIESELFGHEAGAFTGAAKARVGKFEYASGGTLFLDEIESMPLDLQARLLRVLQERNVVRLGSNTEIALDVRVIAATKVDLKAAVEAGTFRRDLLYRLDVLSLTLPPLRRRRDDIPLLFMHLVSLGEDRFKRPAPQVQPAELGLLLAHDWPGNVRELQNVAMRFALGLGVSFGTETEAPAAAAASLPEQLAMIEKTILRAALADAQGSMKAAYERLGISRKTLYEKLRKYGLRTDDIADADEP